MATPIVTSGGTDTSPQSMRGAPRGPALTFRPTGWDGYRHYTQGTVPASGRLLTVQAANRMDEIDLSITTTGANCGFRDSAADARALAAELIAAASTIDGTRLEVCHG